MLVVIFYVQSLRSQTNLRDAVTPRWAVHLKFGTAIERKVNATAVALCQFGGATSEWNLVERDEQGEREREKRASLNRRADTDFRHWHWHWLWPRKLFSKRSARIFAGAGGATAEGGKESAIAEVTLTPYNVSVTCALSCSRRKAPEGRDRREKERPWRESCAGCSWL